MTHEAILEKLNEIFQDIFDDDSLVITETTTANDVEDWDSIEHINLIDAVEKEFGMKFKMQEVSGMKNVGEMVQIIAERCAEPKPKKRGLFRREKAIVRTCLYKKYMWIFEHNFIADKKKIRRRAVGRNLS